jgi:hypothetical protein
MSECSVVERWAPGSVVAALDVSALQMRPVTPEEAQGLSTPAYLFDPAVAVQRYRALRQALGTRLVVSFKANNLRADRTATLRQQSRHGPWIHAGRSHLRLRFHHRQR